MLTFHDNMSVPKIQMTFFWFSVFFLMKNYGITESIVQYIGYIVQDIHELVLSWDWETNCSNRSVMERSNLVFYCRQGRIQGAAIEAISPLKPIKVTLFTMILYNSDTSGHAVVNP